MNHVLEIYALFMFIGIFTTLLIPETKRKTLEELCGEDDLAARFSDSPASSAMHESKTTPADSGNASVRLSSYTQSPADAKVQSV